MDKLLIGEKIKQARLEHGYTQEKLAELVSMHEKHISRIELGKYLPNLNNLIRIFQVLDIEISKCGLNFEVPKEKNQAKKEFIKLINNFSDNELEFYLNVVKQVQKGLIKFKPYK